MWEEQACLVRARSDSEGSNKPTGFGALARTMAYTDNNHATEGSGEPVGAALGSPPEQRGDSTESGELLDYNDAGVLEQFHEDALRQAGCGFSQCRVILACAEAIAGASLELSAIPFILPSAEIELCILPHEKNWLVLISLVGCSLGSVGWGSLGGRLGRRRALLSCLAVNAVFATIAAFMPTYGTFMMARFCSAIGSGGIVPICFTYMCEVSRRCWWRVCGACAVSAAAGGALLAAALATAVLPHTGATTLEENKEHFSAWHRYLLLSTLPILASLVSLIWTQESPRYLLDVGREVDAMMVYQTIHSSNQVRVCGKANVAAAGTTDSDYRLGELSLPGKRRPPALHNVRHSVKMFWQAFFQLFSSPYRRLTLSLGGTLLFSLAIQFYLSSYIPTTVVKMENDIFEASTKTTNNETFDSEFHNNTIENMQYTNCTFRNCTFRDLLMSHVIFRNCTFFDVAFSNIKSSRTRFYGAVFVNSTIIDTDMESGIEFDDWCVFNSTIVRGMKGICSRHADLTSRLGGIVSEQTYLSHAMLIAALFVLLPGKMRPNVLICLACALMAPLLIWAQTETMLYMVEAATRSLVTLVFANVALHIVEGYPANLRCTAHGLLLSLALSGGCAVRGLGPVSTALSVAFCGVAALASALTARKL